MLWKDRLRGDFSSSPIAAAGLVYFQNEAGETFVIQPGPKMNVVAENALDAPASALFRASLTPSREQMFSRSQTHLYCIGKTALPAPRL